MEPTSNDFPPSAFQQQVDELANDLLARGIQPTPMMLERKLTAPRRRLVEALEQWARRLTDDEAAENSPKTASGAMRLVAGLPPAKRQAQFPMAAVLASRVAAGLRENEQRRARRAELLTEIERARYRLEGLEKRLEKGEQAAHLLSEIEKIRRRLHQMNAALDPPR